MDTLLINTINHYPATIAANATVQEAIRRLEQTKQYCILVTEVDTSTFIGLFSERDVVQLTASGLDIAKHCLSTVITRSSLVLKESDPHTIDSVLALFEHHHLYALPIVNGQEQPIGLITLSTLLQALRNRNQHQSQERVAYPPHRSNCSPTEIKLKRQLKRTLLLQKIKDAISAQCEPEEIFKVIVAQIGQAFGVSQCHLLIYNNSPTAQFTPAAHYSTLAAPTQLDEKLFTEARKLQVMAQSQAMILANVCDDSVPQSSESEYQTSQHQQISPSSMLAIRTSHQEKPNGIVVLHQCDRIRQWKASEIRLIEAIATQVGSALAQINRLEQEKQQRHIINQQNLALRQQVREQEALLWNLKQTDERLELFFAQSLEGFFFMMLDQPVQWDDTIDKEKTLDYVFSHQRITKANHSILQQYGAKHEQFIGLTPNDFFSHDLSQGRQIWRQFFDAGRLHVETKEQTFDGKLIWIEGDYICLYNAQGRITGHFGIQRDITDRKRAEEELKAERERWQLVVQASNDGIFDMDLKTGNGFYSERFKEVLGYSNQEFSNTREQWTELLHPDDHDRVIATKELYLKKQIPHLRQEYRLRCKDGTYKWLFDRVLAVWDETGTPIRVLGVSTDISEHKQLEFALQTSEAKLSSILDKLPAALASIRIFPDGTWTVDYRSAGYVQLFGFSIEEFVDDSNLWMSRLEPEDLDRYLTQLRTDVLVEQDGKVEYRYLHPDGTWHWFTSSYTIQWNETAQCWIVFTVDTDITNRKQTEEALHRQQEFLRSVIDIPPNLIFAKDWSGRFVLANQATAEIYGTTVEDLIGKTDADFNPNLPEVEHFLRHDQEVITTQRPTLLDETVTSAAGETFCFQTIKTPIVSLDGQSILALGVATDISDRKQMEQALRLIVEGTAAKTGQEFFHSLVRYLAEVLQVRYAFVTELVRPEYTSARTLAFWNGDKFGENFEYSLANTPCERVLAGEIIFYQNSIQAHFPQHGHLTDLEAESYFGIPLSDSNGNIIGHLKVLDDKPLPQKQFSEQILRIFAARAGAELERKQAEDVLSNLLAQTQQQSIDLKKARDAAEAANRAKSEFLANMSHELRTPLNAVLGFTQIMGRDTCISSENREYVNIINRSGQHLLTLINDVLEMSKIEAGRLKLHSSSFDLYHLLDTLYEMLYLKASGKNLILTFHRPLNLPQYISTDEGKLRQVLLNLLGNAIKFTQIGQVMLRVAVVPKQLEEQENKNSAQQPITLHFEVEDTGPGVAPGDLHRLFTPFVQTPTGQQSAEGTGLGLTISQTFVHLLGGEITVESVVGQGSIFRFSIQADVSQAGSLSASYSSRRVVGLAPNKDPFRLLIVEDRWENQQVLVKLLQPLGFEIQIASNGQEGVTFWEHWCPHGILMDMRMPVMDGYEATRQIRAKAVWEASQEDSISQRNEPNPANNKRPATKIIAVTSSAFDEERSTILEMGCDDIISKPFREEEIFAKLAQHLGVQYLFEDREDLEEMGQSDQHFYSPLPRFSERDLVIAASLLKEMPEVWIAQLHQAAILGKDRQMLQLIEQIPSSHRPLVQTLQEWVNNYRFEEIVELTKPTGYE
jgi:two-component system, sensor histidine kinase and response regulator